MMIYIQQIMIGVLFYLWIEREHGLLWGKRNEEEDQKKVTFEID